MEAEYDEVLHWVDPGPAVPGEAAAPSEAPWGAGHTTSRCGPAFERETDQLIDGRQLRISIPGRATSGAKIPEGPWRLAA